MARSKRSKRAQASLPVSLRDVQHRANTVLRDARKRVDAMLPAGPRKEIARIEARVSRLQKDVEKAGKQARKRFETRSRRLLTTAEKRVAAVVKPIVTRLDLASKGDVDKLRKRIGDLERKVHEAVRTHTVAA